MSEPSQSDLDVKRRLRRVAHHLEQSGSQHRARPTFEVDGRFGMMKLRNRVGLWIAVAAVSVGVVGFTLLTRSTSRSEFRVPVQLANDGTSTSDDSSIDLENGEQQENGRPDGDVGGSNGVGEGSGLPDGDSDVGISVGVGENSGRPDGDVGGNDGIDINPETESTFPSDTLSPTTSSPVDIDLQGPRIQDVSFPTNVRAGSWLTFRWRVVDPDLVSATGVRVGWANGIFSSCGFGELGTLERGTSRDGEWSYTCWIPSNAVSTVYSVSIWASDMLGHNSDFSNIAFNVEGGNDDASPPLYSNVRVENDVSPGGTLVIYWSLADPSGIEGAVMWVAGPTGGFTNLETEKSYANYATLDIRRSCNAAGDLCDYTQSVQIDLTSPIGEYTLWVSATDKLGNKVLNSLIQFNVTN